MRSVSKLAELALQGEHGRKWYAQAERAVRSYCYHSNTDVVHFVAVLAILSPKMQVKRNVEVTKAYHAAVKRYGSEINTHRWVPGLMGATHRRACEIYERTGRINGRKTSAFAAAILGDGEAIVLDTWMAKALQIAPDKITKNTTIWIKACKRVRRVARKLGWPPAEVQAAIWTAMYEAKHRPEHRTPGIEHFLGAVVPPQPSLNHFDF